MELPNISAAQNCHLLHMNTLPLYGLSLLNEVTNTMFACVPVHTPQYNSNSYKYISCFQTYILHFLCWHIFRQKIVAMTYGLTYVHELHQYLKKVIKSRLRCNEHDVSCNELLC